MSSHVDDGYALAQEAERAEWRGRSTPAAVRRWAEFSATPLAYLILPNLPMILLREKLTLVPRGDFNIECLLLGICSLFVSPYLIFTLLLFDMAGGFIYELCYSYQFHFADVLIAARSAPELPATRIMEVAVAFLVVAGIAAVTAFLVPRPKHRMATAFAMAGFAVLLTGLDMGHGQNPYLHPAGMTSSRLTMAPWSTLALRGELSFGGHSQSRVNLSPMPSASAAMLSQTGLRRERTRPNIVLVVVESWGLFSDSALAQSLASPYEDGQLRAGYDVTYGVVPFDGLTVPGEGRELCHSHVGFGILDIAGKTSQGCLPDELKRMGYLTIAVHGNPGGIFARSQWYRKLGFEQDWFRPELSKEGLSMCPGIFPGICDASISEWIGTKLLAGDAGTPKFIYWVTLNSHIPVPLNPQLAPDSACSSIPALEQSAPLCSWFRLVHHVHEAVRQLAIREDDQPTVFVVVGDHAPPFAQQDLRAQFSQAVVPYVILTPKSLPGGQHTQRATRMEASLGGGRRRHGHALPPDAAKTKPTGSS